MPGLIGFSGRFGQKKSEAILGEMSQAMKLHDWYQVDLHAGEDFGLGRVSLGKLNPQPQPIWNQDKTLAIVMEGEIYGYENIKEKLIQKGYKFHKNDDPEFILCLYEEYGKEFLSQINGAFVIAIWNSKIKSLVLANDRLGLLPIYYAHSNGNFIFASSMIALLTDASLSRNVDVITISQLLAFEYPLGNRTLLNNVQLLPPATILTFQNKNLKLQAYWNLEFEDTVPLKNKEEYIDELYLKLQQAITRQTDDYFSSGVLLSGGLDSRLIVALLHEHPNTNHLYTFTFGIPGCDDARIAKTISQVTGTNNVFSNLNSDYLLELANEGVRITNGEMSVVHMHVLANLHKQAQYVDVIYKGYFGDALMGGHLNLKLWADYDINILSRLLFDDTCVLFQQNEQKELFTDSIQNKLGDTLFESFKIKLAESKATLVANRQNHFDLMQRQRRFILNGVGLSRSQAIIRTPFCDNDLVEFMLKVPPGLRLNRRLVVKILDKYYHDLAKVPYEGTGTPLVPSFLDLRIRFNRQLRWRLRKAGISWVQELKRRPYADYNEWMRTILQGWVEDTLLSKSFLGRGYFNPDKICNLVEEQMAGANHARKIGMLITLELWHRQFLD